MCSGMDSDTNPLGFRKGRRCANCNARVGDRGPDSFSGEYYCREEDCRAIRESRRQAVYRKPWKSTALRVSLEIEQERQRDAPHVAELRAAGMTDLQIRRQFPLLRL